MNRRDIEALAERAFHQRLGPLNPRKSRRGADIIVGLDTEYDSDDGSPVSLQLSYEGSEHFSPLAERISLDDLAERAIQLSGADAGDRLYLACYWSPAELSTVAGDWWMRAKIVPVNGQGVVNAEWECGGVSIILYDVFHWFDPAPLAKAAEAFGLKKLEWDRTRVSRASLKEPGFREYAMNDAHLAEKLLRGLRDILLERGVDILRSRTPASASMRLYREQWLKTEVRQPSYALRRVAMRANLGGIGEAYVHADVEGEFDQIDFDSLYPTAVISLGGFPTKPSDWHVLRRGQGLPEGVEGICKVRFAFPEEEQYPCLPVVVKDRGMTFPLTGISYCTIAEARVAESFGARVDYWQAWYYRPEECDDSYPKYLESLLSEKRRLDRGGDKVVRIAVKFLMNAGIGKFSQRRGADIEDLKRISEEDGIPLSIVAASHYKHPDKVRRGIPGDAWCPEWHALILGKARSLMFPFMRLGKGLLTTTDSILATHEGAEAILQASGGLVKWKLEATTKKVRIIRQRLYQIDGGKTAHHAVHLKHDDACRLIAETPLGGSVRYQSKKRFSLLDALQEKGLYGAPRLREFVYNASWGGKRQLLADGTTRPWASVDAMEGG